MEKASTLIRVNMKWLVVIIAVLGINQWTGTDAFAQDRGPCADDAAKFCKDVQPGGGRIAKCLKQHEGELSPACRERMAEMKKKLHEFHQACEDDVMKLCKDVQPGGGRILRCLKEHKNELSPECKAKMEQAKRK